MGGIETDYLVVGAGAAGMAFVDALIGACDADVVMVDRRHVPGGHWNDAYPFVRLHGPSALYGVNSRSLGTDSIEQTGPNAGYYPRATAAEICDYYQRVLDEHLLPSGHVRFFGMSDCMDAGRGEHRFVSRLTGDATTVRVRRKVVDARYLEPSIPATHVPSFDAEPGVRLIPVNDLVRLDGPASGFTVIGAGKTAIDGCLWLLDSGVPPEAICWIRPRDAWLLDRAFQQPLDLVPRLMEGVSLYLEAAAQADGISDLFRRLEACGQLIRIDRDVEPAMYRCATVSEAELVRLRSIQNVVRLGRVTHIGPDRIELEHGSIPRRPAGRSTWTARRRDCAPSPAARCSPIARSRSSRSGPVSRSSAPLCPATWRPPATTMRRRTCSARRTRIRSRPGTGYRSPASPSAPRWHGSPTRTCRPGCSDHGSMPPAGSATISTTR